MNKTISDKVQFIVHKIIIGIAFWIISSVVITYQQYIINQFKNTLLSSLLYLVPMLVLSWFISISLKKYQWTPLGSNSDLIGIIIIIAVSAILLFTIGILKVII